MALAIAITATCAVVNAWALPPQYAHSSRPSSVWRGLDRTNGPPHFVASTASSEPALLARQAVPAPQIWAVCGLPACLGFWRAEYGVSYGYSIATAMAGFILLHTMGGSIPVSAQALCLVLYGSRLGSFLLYREVCIAKFRDFRDKVEERAKSRGGRLKRAPFIFSCALLYLGLAAPTVLAVKASEAGVQLEGAGAGGAALTFQGFVAAMYVGWFWAALGDAYKSWRKRVRGEGALVTGGPFAVMRHPNYTGEQLLWTANFAAGVVAALAGGPRTRSVSMAGWLVASLLGVMGINYVLMQATGGLQTRQASAYAGNPHYETWVSRTWGGFALVRSRGKTTEGSNGGDVAEAAEDAATDA